MINSIMYINKLKYIYYVIQFEYEEDVTCFYIKFLNFIYAFIY